MQVDPIQLILSWITVFERSEASF